MKIIATFAIVAITTLGIFTPANADEVERLEAQVISLQSKLTSHGAEYDNYTAKMKRIGDEMERVSAAKDPHLAEASRHIDEMERISVEVERLETKAKHYQAEAERHLHDIDALTPYLNARDIYLAEAKRHIAEFDRHKAEAKNHYAEVDRLDVEFKHLTAEFLVVGDKRDYHFKESNRLIEKILILEEKITEAQTIEH